MTATMSGFDANMCRVCLQPKSDEDFENVFKDNDELSDMGYMYQDVLHLTIYPDKTHPQYLCVYCVLHLKLFNKFRTRAVESFNLFANDLFKEETMSNISNPVDIDIYFDLDKVSGNLECYEINKVDSIKGEEEVEFEEVQYLEEEIPNTNDVNITTTTDEGCASSTQIEIVPDIVDDDSSESEESDDNYEPPTSLRKPRRRKAATNSDDSHSDVEYPCKRCDQVFVKKSSLENHKKAEHPRTKYNCSLCPKVFYSEEALQVHINVHKGLPAYKCDQCEKTFKQKAHFVYHMMGHRNERNAQCHLCGKGFLNNSDLRIHMRVHNDERRYECDVCGKRFRAYSHMTNHRYSHFEKQLECPTCLQKYSSPNTLKTHIKAVHKRECPYECEVCMKKFKRKHHLKAHYKIHQKM